MGREQACEVIQVIRTNLHRRGKGVEGDPIRVITQYWSMDGYLLWEFDPFELRKQYNAVLPEGQKISES